MTRASVIKDEKDAEKAYQESRSADGEAIQPGCSEPNTQPPSVMGTTQDTKRKPPEET